MTFTGLGNSSGVPRDLILDEDLVGMDVTGDETAPTVSDVDASSGTFPGAVAVASNILVDFSEEMLEATITTTNLKIIKISDGSVVAAAVTYTAGTPSGLPSIPTPTSRAPPPTWCWCATRCVTQLAISWPLTTPPPSPPPNAPAP